MKSCISNEFHESFKCFGNISRKDTQRKKHTKNAEN